MCHFDRILARVPVSKQVEAVDALDRRELLRVLGDVGHAAQQDARVAFDLAGNGQYLMLLPERILTPSLACVPPITQSTPMRDADSRD